VLSYAKTHTCAWDWEGVLTPGDSFPVATLDTRSGPVRVGAMICYDREFPETARWLMLGGAEMILNPNACTLEMNRIGQFRARAFENMLAVAMTNYPAPQANGHSVAFDGMVCNESGNMRDMLLVEAGEGEQIVLATIDLAALRAYRERETWGAFRRPELYGAISE
jgi:predicted amidohydrolase